MVASWVSAWDVPRVPLKVTHPALQSQQSSKLQKVRGLLTTERQKIFLERSNTKSQEIWNQNVYESTSSWKKLSQKWQLVTACHNNMVTLSCSEQPRHPSLLLTKRKPGRQQWAVWSKQHVSLVPVNISLEFSSLIWQLLFYYLPFIHL